MPPEEMVAHYRAQKKLVDIDGLQSVEGVTADVIRAIGDRGQ
jgi:hypothetical protein